MNFTVKVSLWVEEISWLLATFIFILYTFCPIAHRRYVKTRLVEHQRADQTSKEMKKIE